MNSAAVNAHLDKLLCGEALSFTGLGLLRGTRPSGNLSSENSRSGLVACQRSYLVVAMPGQSVPLTSDMGVSVEDHVSLYTVLSFLMSSHSKLGR